MIECDCKNCGRRFPAERPAEWCSQKCYQAVHDYDLCECGRRKTKKAKKCNGCRVEFVAKHAQLAAELYRSGMKMSAVARRLKCAESCVFKMLKLANVPRRQRGHSIPV